MPRRVPQPGAGHGISLRLRHTPNLNSEEEEDACDPRFPGYRSLSNAVSVRDKADKSRERGANFSSAPNQAPNLRSRTMTQRLAASSILPPVQNYNSYDFLNINLTTRHIPKNCINIVKFKLFLKNFY